MVCWYSGMVRVLSPYLCLRATALYLYLLHVQEQESGADAIDRFMHTPSPAPSPGPGPVYSMSSPATSYMSHSRVCCRALGSPDLGMGLRKLLRLCVHGRVWVHVCASVSGAAQDPGGLWFAEYVLPVMPCFV